MAKKEKEITRISDLVPDANNYNKGTEFGQGLIEKSIRKNGLGRSLLIDKNGRVIAGNKTLEATVASGFDEDKIRVIKTDGTELIVVQRTDLDLDTRKGKEMALADNATSKANLAWDYEALGADFETPDLEAWGVFNREFHDANNMTEEDVDLGEEFDPVGLSADIQRVVFLFDNKGLAEDWLKENAPTLTVKKMNMAWQVNLTTLYT